MKPILITAFIISVASAAFAAPEQEVDNFCSHKQWEANQDLGYALAIPLEGTQALATALRSSTDGLLLAYKSARRAESRTPFENSNLVKTLKTLKGRLKDSSQSLIAWHQAAMSPENADETFQIDVAPILDAVKFASGVNFSRTSIIAHLVPFPELLLRVLNDPSKRNFERLVTLYADFLEALEGDEDAKNAKKGFDTVSHYLTNSYAKDCRSFYLKGSYTPNVFHPMSDWKDWLGIKPQDVVQLYQWNFILNAWRIFYVDYRQITEVALYAHPAVYQETTAALLKAGWKEDLTMQQTVAVIDRVLDKAAPEHVVQLVTALKRGITTTLEALDPIRSSTDYDFERLVFRPLMINWMGTMNTAELEHEVHRTHQLLFHLFSHLEMGDLKGHLIGITPYLNIIHELFEPTVSSEMYHSQPSDLKPSMMDMDDIREHLEKMKNR